MDTEVEPGDLVAHASHLDGLVERLGTAVSAADIAMNDDAYGLLCAFLPPIINPTGEKAKETLQAAVEAVQTTSDNVRTAATAYEEGDKANAEPFIKQLATARESSVASSPQLASRQVNAVQGESSDPVAAEKRVTGVFAQTESSPQMASQRVDAVQAESPAMSTSDPVAADERVAGAFSQSESSPPVASLRVDAAQGESPAVSTSDPAAAEERVANAFS